MVPTVQTIALEIRERLKIDVNAPDKVVTDVCDNISGERVVAAALSTLDTDNVILGRLSHKPVQGSPFKHADFQDTSDVADAFHTLFHLSPPLAVHTEFGVSVAKQTTVPIDVATADNHLMLIIEIAVPGGGSMLAASCVRLCCSVKLVRYVDLSPVIFVVAAVVFIDDQVRSREYLDAYQNFVCVLFSRSSGGRGRSDGQSPRICGSCS